MGNRPGDHSAGAPAASMSEDLSRRLERLGVDLARARASSSARDPDGDVASRAHAHRAAAALGGLLVAGAVAGGVVSATAGSGGNEPVITGWLDSHVAAGTRIGVVGGVGSVVPDRYPTVSVAGSGIAAVERLHYAVGPDPITVAGSTVSSYMESHATLVAVQPGQASLWEVTAAPAPTEPTVPARPVPAAPTEPTVPAPTVPAAPEAATTVVVHAGDSFWSIAHSVLRQHLGMTPSPAQLAHYWARTVAANADRLAYAGDPNILFTGQIIVVPAP